jgi:nitrite reductase (NADH) small subunit
MSTWIEIGRLEDIPLRGARVLRTEGGDIAVFRSTDNRVFALDDRCPHRKGPLSQGIVHGWRVTCALHNWAIELTNGAAVAPDEGCATKYPVRIKGEMIFIHIEQGEVTRPRLEAIPA